VAGDFAIRFNDWKGGDWGRRDPARANADQFSAVNVYPYDSGLLGVRAGLKALDVAGLPDHPVSPGPVGFDVDGDDLVVALGATYRVPLGGGSATPLPAYSAAAASPVQYANGNGDLYSLVSGTGVLYRHVSDLSTTAVSTPVALSQVVRWGLFMVGVDAATPWRVYYSQVDESGPAFDVWPANNYTDVGNHEPITALVPIGNALYVGKASGWWVLTGVLGETETVRDVLIGNGPIDHRYTTVTTDQRVIYWPQDDPPAWFNGDTVRFDDDHVVAGRDLDAIASNGVIVTPTARRLILAAADTDGVTTLLMWKDRAWTRHTTGFKLGGIAPGNVRAATSMPARVVYVAGAPTTVGDPAVIATFHHDLDRPGHADDTYAAPVDTGDTGLLEGSASFPAWYDGQGRQIRVRSVIVQFRKWASGVADTYNRIRVRVDALGEYGGGNVASDTVEWREACARATSSGTDDSWRVNFGDQGWANGFQVHLPLISGVAIREIVVVCETKGTRT
jgi:hypothetical protein